MTKQALRVPKRTKTLNINIKLHNELAKLAIDSGMQVGKFADYVIAEFLESKGIDTTKIYTPKEEKLSA